MTNHPIPHPADAEDFLQQQVRKDPDAFAKDLADQHFHEAIDMLVENAREDLTTAIYKELRMTIPPAHFETILSAYEARISAWARTLPADLPEEG